uniref:Uncharacterized protein n=1 Tax=Rhodnius prolixus TaxID=13249 RepID=T1HWR4_RHOPR
MVTKYSKLLAVFLKFNDNLLSFNVTVYTEIQLVKVLCLFFIRHLGELPFDSV